MAKNQANGSSLGIEATLWQTADKLRGHLDAAEWAARDSEADIAAAWLSAE